MSDEQQALPLLVLTLDGGGIRGLSSLLILRFLTRRLQAKINNVKKDLPKDDVLHNLKNDALYPCNLFDLIAGTSTGGLNALMLGRLRMSVDDCIQVYTKFAEEVFKQKTLPGWGWFSKARGGPMYDANVLVQKVKDIVKEYNGDSTKLADPKGEEACKTFVLAVCKGYVDAPPRRFRTYATSTSLADDCEIWEAVRATTAAITFFDAVEIGRPKEVFIDGALGGYNNPTEQALYEAREIWEDRKLGCVLSLGTGKPDIVKMKGSLPELAKACLKLVLSCEVVDDKVARKFSNTSSNPYIRLTVTRGLEDILVDEWEKMEGDHGLTNVTEGFMKEPEQEEKADRFVEVMMARLRGSEPGLT